MFKSLSISHLITFLNFINQALLSMKKKIVVLLFIELLTLQSCLSKDVCENYTKKYDLNFTMDSCTLFPWFENSAYHRCYQSFFIRDAGRKLFTQVYQTEHNGYYSDMLKTELMQRIYLPVNPETHGSLSFECKGENIDYSLLEINLINSEEKIIYADTVKVIPNKQFKEVSLNFPLRDAEIMSIKIYAQGKYRINSAFVFSNLRIKIGSNRIDAYPLREFSNDVKIQDTDLIKINQLSNHEFDKIKGLNTNIVGLAEVMHGNNSIKELAHSILTNQARSGNCKFILIEMPIEQSLPFNRYIIDNDFCLDSIQKEYAKSKELLCFLDTLKKINTIKKENEKVELLGFDYRYNFDCRQVNRDLFDYIYELNQIEKNRFIDTLNLLIIKDSLQRSYRYFVKRNKEMRSFFKQNDYDYLTHIYGIDMQMEQKEPATRMSKRDSVMFLNVNFIINLLNSDDKKIFLYGHSAHLNPISTYPAVPCLPLGHYLKKKYSDNYSVHLLTIATGENITESNFSQVKLPLKKPPYGSIEYILNKNSYSQSYLCVTPRFNTLFLTRFIGLSNTSNEFFYVNIFQRYNGVFFIKNDNAKTTNNLKLKTNKQKWETEELATKLRNLRLNEIIERQKPK